jgi:arylsulfatase A-like enzyme
MSHAKPRGIVVLMSDDHARWALNCYGNHEVLTPTMDFLAGGAKMDRAYTPTPVCSPARASFFTGRTPSQHGVHDYIAEWWGTGRDHPGLAGQYNLGELLQQGGYHTGLVGKWHCGGGGGDRGVQPGFDRWFSFHEGVQTPHFGDMRFNDQGRVVELHGHRSTFVTDRAIEFLRQRPAEKPFFLFCGYVSTHTPHAQQPERLVSHYRGARFADIPTDQAIPAAYHANPTVKPPADENQRREGLAQYYASVTLVDEQAGRILDELDNLGLSDDTLVVYVSDHGDMRGHHGLQGKGNATVPQNLLEESIRVPMLLRWPGRIQPGTVCEAFVDHCDLFATLLDASGVSISDAIRREIHSPGRSFLPMLQGERQEWRDAQFCEYGNARMIRTGRHKFIRRYRGPNGRFSDELYDLSADPLETTNLIDDPAQAAAIAALGKRLDDYFAEYEIPGRSGVDVGERPPANPCEIWRMVVS